MAAMVVKIIRVLLPLILFVSSCKAMALYGKPVENVAVVPPTTVQYSVTFENGTSLLRPPHGRVKRHTCMDRPAAEVLEYFELRLPGRCWDDCDCSEGRYCTSHSWCHDITKKQP